MERLALISSNSRLSYCNSHVRAIAAVYSISDRKGKNVGTKERMRDQQLIEMSEMWGWKSKSKLMIGCRCLMEGRALPCVAVLVNLFDKIKHLFKQFVVGPFL